MSHPSPHPLDRPLAPDDRFVDIGRRSSRRSTSRLAAAHGAARIVDPVLALLIGGLSGALVYLVLDRL